MHIGRGLIWVSAVDLPSRMYAHTRGEHRAQYVSYSRQLNDDMRASACDRRGEGFGIL